MSIPSISMQTTMMTTGTAEVRQEGRITIPASIRRELDLDEGDFVVFKLEKISQEVDSQ